MGNSNDISKVQVHPQKEGIKRSNILSLPRNLSNLLSLDDTEGIDFNMDRSKFITFLEDFRSSIIKMAETMDGVDLIQSQEFDSLYEFHNNLMKQLTNFLDLNTRINHLREVKNVRKELNNLLENLNSVMNNNNYFNGDISVNQVLFENFFRERRKISKKIEEYPNLKKMIGDLIKDYDQNRLELNIYLKKPRFKESLNVDTENNEESKSNSHNQEEQKSVSSISSNNSAYENLNEDFIVSRAKFNQIFSSASDKILQVFKSTHDLTKHSDTLVNLRNQVVKVSKNIGSRRLSNLPNSINNMDEFDKIVRKNKLLLSLFLSQLSTFKKDIDLLWPEIIEKKNMMETFFEDYERLWSKFREFVVLKYDNAPGSIKSSGSIEDDSERTKFNMIMKKRLLVKGNMEFDESGEWAFTCNFDIFHNFGLICKTHFVEKEVGIRYPEIVVYDYISGQVIQKLNLECTEFENLKRGIVYCIEDSVNLIYKLIFFTGASSLACSFNMDPETMELDKIPEIFDLKTSRNQEMRYTIKHKTMVIVNSRGKGVTLMDYETLEHKKIILGCQDVLTGEFYDEDNFIFADQNFLFLYNFNYDTLRKVKTYFGELQNSIAINKKHNRLIMADDSKNIHIFQLEICSNYFAKFIKSVLVKCENSSFRLDFLTKRKILISNIKNFILILDLENNDLFEKSLFFNDWDIFNYKIDILSKRIFILSSNYYRNMTKIHVLEDLN